MRVSFTGHRTIDRKLIDKKLSDILPLLIEKGADSFYAGGAVGFDTEAALKVIEYREAYPWIELNLILPCPPEVQSSLFSERQRFLYFDVLREADSVECVSQEYDQECMKKRNMRLIENADICVCYFDEKKLISGTGQTVRMAQKKNIKIINLFTGEEQR